MIIRHVMRRFALSERGARDFLRGVCCTLMLDLALMLPAVYLFVFLADCLSPSGGFGGGGRGVAVYALLGLAMMAVMMGVAVLQYRSTYISVYAESAVRRISLAEKLRKLPMAFFGEKDLADLTSTIMDDCTDLEHTFSHAVPQPFAAVISIVLVAAGMFAYDWRMASALFWVVPVAFAVVLLSKRMMRRGNVATYRAHRVVSEYIQEGLDTVQEIKAYNREEYYGSVLSSLIDDCEREMTRGELLLGVMVNGAQSLLRLGLASVIIVGASLVASGQSGVFDYLMFLAVASRVYSPVGEVLENMAALFYLDVRIARMNEIEAMPVQTGTTHFAPDGHDIAFEHVGFSYSSGACVLDDVTFTARQGQVTALVGPSGGGKSTAARLAARFWDVQRGCVKVGGVDVSQVDPETLLADFAIVFQDVMLFNASVMDNIRVGRPGASDDDVMRVARLACVDQFVRRLPQGYDTVIGENGSTLSGGERQRISIARALLKDAPIVLLDEATASLDVGNETLLQRGLSRLVSGKTVLVIAHRLRTVANADKVVVLDGGRVVETGDPAVLLQDAGSRFARMAAMQGGLISAV